MRSIDADKLKETLVIMANKCGGALDILDISDAIEKAPTVERPQWIPCSERLPNPNELVVVSLITGVQLCEYAADGSSDSWFSLTDNCWVLNRLIKAWMPLPKPYKKAGE